MRRRNNQDSYFEMLADNKQAWEKTGYVMGVADGMGAHAAGELASRLAVDLIPLHYTKLQKTIPAEALARSITETNSEIYRRGQANPEFRNMGTTASVLTLLPEGAVVGHVGDSRVYRSRGQQLEQLTFDHSLVWEMEASGEVNEETIKSGIIPKNVITRSLGPNPSVQVDLEGPFPIQQGDRFLLCSDGLSGQIADLEIGVILQLFEPKEATQLFVDLANLRGGPDNITVIVALVSTNLIATEGATIPARGDSFFDGFSTTLGLITAICTLTAVVFGLMGLWPFAILIGGLGLVALVTGIVQRVQARSRAEAPGDRYGRGPHRRFQCKADQKFVDQLIGTINSLREAATENDWKFSWSELEVQIEKGRAAEKGNQFSQAIQIYGKVIMETMRLIREQRKKPPIDPESID